MHVQQFSQRIIRKMFVHFYFLWYMYVLNCTLTFLRYYLHLKGLCKKKKLLYFLEFYKNSYVEVKSYTQKSTVVKAKSQVKDVILRGDKIIKFKGINSSPFA